MKNYILYALMLTMSTLFAVPSYSFEAKIQSQQEMFHTNYNAVRKKLSLPPAKIDPNIQEAAEAMSKDVALVVDNLGEILKHMGYPGQTYAAFEVKKKGKRPLFIMLMLNEQFSFMATRSSDQYYGMKETATHVYLILVTKGQRVPAKEPEYKPQSIYDETTEFDDEDHCGTPPYVFIGV